MVEVKGKGISSQASTAKRENDTKVMNQGRRGFDKVRLNRRRLKNHKSLLVTSTCSFSSDAGAYTNKDMRSDVEGQDRITMNESHDGVLGTFEEPSPHVPEEEPWIGDKDFGEKVINGTASSYAADDAASISDVSDCSFPSLCQASPIGRSTSTMDANTVSSDWSYTTTDSFTMTSLTPKLQYKPTPLLEGGEIYSDDEQEQELLPQLKKETGKNTSESVMMSSLAGKSSRERSLVLCYERGREMTAASLKLQGGDNKGIPHLFQCESSTCSQMTKNSNAVDPSVPTPTVMVKTKTRGTKTFAPQSMIHGANPSNPVDYLPTELDPVLAIGGGAPSSPIDSEDEDAQTDITITTFERMKDEFMGTLDDTRKAFHDIIHAFSLRSSDIKSVWKRIDKAKDEMDRSLHGRNKNTTVPSTVDVMATRV